MLDRGYRINSSVTKTRSHVPTLNATRSFVIRIRHLQSVAWQLILLCSALAASTMCCDEKAERASTRPAPGPLFPAYIGTKMGYIDAKGNVAIPARFDVAAEFHEGL